MKFYRAENGLNPPISMQKDWHNEGFNPPKTAFPNTERRGFNTPLTSQPVPKPVLPQNPQK